MNGRNNKVGKGANKGKNNGGAYGPGGYCVCAKCGYKLPLQNGVKCTKIKCPECGTPMIREELLNEKRNKKTDL